jgi:PIN domain nuclease of toxin-antitoxin system
VRLLLDTHVLLWWLADDSKLGKEARGMIADPGNQVAVSAATVWEIAIKVSLKKIEIDLEHLENGIAESGFDALPIVASHAIKAGQLPAIHRDPFDRMLIAQAVTEELRLVTHDGIFKRYRLEAEGLPPIFV